MAGPFIIPVAEGIPFDNETNGFVADNVQEAIEEAAAGGGGAIFGTGFQYAESEGESSTTSTSYQEKLNLTTPSLGAGTYRVGWYYEWKFSNGNFEFKNRVQVDDAITLKETETTPRSVGDWQGAAGFDYVVLAAGTHNIDLDYCSSKKNKTARIRKARLEIWRVE